jgi:hypothetical protein
MQLHMLIGNNRNQELPPPYPATPAYKKPIGREIFISDSLNKSARYQKTPQRELIRAHRERYQSFWRWSDAALDTASLTGSLHTFGWSVHMGENIRPTFLRNFPMQANGAEMMRIAACLGTERGVEICAPVHDAFLIIAPLDRLEADITAMQAAMAEASCAVLDGFELRTEASITRFPDRYMDQRGRMMWDKVITLLSRRHQEGRLVA